MEVLVTGASGYVGRALMRDLERAGHSVRPVVRTKDRLPVRWRDRAITVGDIGPDTVWQLALDGVEAIMHLAAPGVVPGDPDGEGARVIVAGTERLLQAAAANGVRRIVFLSSVKAMGEVTEPHGASETSRAEPEDAYGAAKLAAEMLMLTSPIESVVVRSPAIYGRGSGGNVRQMIDFLRSAPPVLPLGYTGNRRSFVHRDNLVSALVACVERDQAAGKTFIVTDGAPESTGALARRILRALERRAVVLPIPGAVLRRLCAARWGPEAARRLVDSYAFDDSAIRQTLGWVPAIDPTAAMADAVVAGPDPLLSGDPGEPPC